MQSTAPPSLTASSNSGFHRRSSEKWALKAASKSIVEAKREWLQWFPTNLNVKQFTQLYFNQLVVTVCLTFFEQKSLKLRMLKTLAEG